MFSLSFLINSPYCSQSKKNLKRSKSDPIVFHSSQMNINLLTQLILHYYLYPHFPAIQLSLNFIKSTQVPTHHTAIAHLFSLFKPPLSLASFHQGKLLPILLILAQFTLSHGNLPHPPSVQIKSPGYGFLACYTLFL